MAYIAEWFKVIKDGQLIGAVTDQSFARYSEKSGRIHICKAMDGQYIVVNDHFYRDDWMLPLNSDDHTEFEEATVVVIDENEYNILVRADSGEPINVSRIIEKESQDEEKAINEKEAVTVEFVRKRKLDELRQVCENVISSGFDLVLSDGVSHHFSMSVEDQINLIGLQRAVDQNEDPVYHADGELMQFYSIEDAQDILIGASKWKNYHIALYNSLKNWINNIDDIEVIDSVKFDSEIPDRYCTVVLQSLTENF
jgi:hypothetical protein